MFEGISVDLSLLLATKQRIEWLGNDYLEIENIFFFWFYYAAYFWSATNFVQCFF